MMHSGERITTIEGLGEPGKLHPMQAAFVEHDAFQCGYCTSGQIMSATALTRESCGPTDDDVRHAMYGNICRCGAYSNIVAAGAAGPQTGLTTAGEFAFLQTSLFCRGRNHQRLGSRTMDEFRFTIELPPSRKPFRRAQSPTAQLGATVRFVASGCKPRRPDEAGCRAA